MSSTDGIIKQDYQDSVPLFVFYYSSDVPSPSHTDYSKVKVEKCDILQLTVLGINDFIIVIYQLFIFQALLKPTY